MKESNYNISVNFVTEDLIANYVGAVFSDVPTDLRLLEDLEKIIPMNIPTTDNGDIIHWTSKDPVYNQHWDNGELPVYLEITFKKGKDDMNSKALNVIESILKKKESIEAIGERVRKADSYFKELESDLLNGKKKDEIVAYADIKFTDLKWKIDTTACSPLNKESVINIISSAFGYGKYDNKEDHTDEFAEMAENGFFQLTRVDFGIDDIGKITELSKLDWFAKALQNVYKVVTVGNNMQFRFNKGFAFVNGELRVPLTRKWLTEYQQLATAFLHLHGPKGIDFYYSNNGPWPYIFDDRNFSAGRSTLEYRHICSPTPNGVKTMVRDLPWCEIKF